MHNGEGDHAREKPQNIDRESGEFRCFSSAQATVVRNEYYYEFPKRKVMIISIGTDITMCS